MLNCEASLMWHHVLHLLDFKLECAQAILELHEHLGTNLVFTINWTRLSFYCFPGWIQCELCFTNYTCLVFINLPDTFYVILSCCSDHFNSLFDLQIGAVAEHNKVFLQGLHLIFDLLNRILVSLKRQLEVGGCWSWGQSLNKLLLQSLESDRYLFSHLI